MLRPRPLLSRGSSQYFPGAPSAAAGHRFCSLLDKNVPIMIAARSFCLPPAFLGPALSRLFQERPARWYGGVTSAGMGRSSICAPSRASWRGVATFLPGEGQARSQASSSIAMTREGLDVEREEPSVWLTGIAWLVHRDLHGVVTQCSWGSWPQLGDLLHGNGPLSTPWPSSPPCSEQADCCLSAQIGLSPTPQPALHPATAATAPAVLTMTSAGHGPQSTALQPTHARRSRPRCRRGGRLTKPGISSGTGLLFRGIMS
ncbi:hypothetical protein F5X68DRAFT_45842 [Plectosphaerella plurivora]|uniref:Uncharacterized protein n=1 Tax=Plectosphaerella plurivora TaxID=936078 RepID=A0A9P8VKR8_9PEZI|nr:hypothetical protein F5X68DRAFT_45842 [Plectosphaerella plurivora]